MTIKKGYKKTDIGEIPVDWEVVLLKDISFMKGRIGWQGLKQTEFTNNLDEPFLITGMNFKDGEIRWNEVYHVSEERYNIAKEIQLRNQDVLMTKDGTIGKLLFVNNIPYPYQATLNSHLLVFRPLQNKYLPKFLYYQLSSKYFKNFVELNKSGTTFFGISQEAVGNYPFILPPLPEQKAIAKVLSDMDNLITALEAEIEKMRLVKQGAMQELLSAGDDWEVRTVFELADNKKQLFDDGDWIEAEHITDKGIRLIQTGNIGVGKYVEKSTKKYIYEKSYEQLKCKPLRQGDLLICRLAAPAGRACIFPNINEDVVITSVDVTIFRPNIENVNRDFLNQYFSTKEWFDKINENVGGTTHKRISRGALGKIEIPLPPLSEQTRIAKILTDIDLTIGSKEAELEKYRAMKVGLMQELLSGKRRLVRG